MILLAKEYGIIHDVKNAISSLKEAVRTVIDGRVSCIRKANS
jgi:hypothetical protein